jgi:hypothetical protein
MKAHVNLMFYAIAPSAGDHDSLVLVNWTCELLLFRWSIRGLMEIPVRTARKKSKNSNREQKAVAGARRTSPIDTI